MPVEFLHETGDNSKDYKLLMAYDGSGRRISKTRYAKDDQFGYWYLDHVTHYTGIGTEVREAMRRSASPKPDVVVNMPQGLGRYGVERYSDSYVAKSANENTQASFEWFLKNHIGSTMLVYGTQTVDDAGFVDLGSSKAAYDYRAFGEQITLSEPTEKITENFTGKEKDDETELNYFGARYLDPMLGLWISVDPARQFSSPYLYAGNGVNPVNGEDPDGNIITFASKDEQNMFANLYSSLTIEAKSNIAVLSASKNVYNLNFREPQQTMVFEDTYGDPIKNKTSYGKFESNATGAEIYFDGTAKSLGHELGGHGFQYEQILNIFLENGIDGQGAANLFKNTYNVNEEWRTGIEKEAARIGGHEYDSKAYEDFD